MRMMVVAALAAFLVSHAQAAEKEVQIRHQGLALNGALTLAEGKAMADGVVLITHGTLAHNGMEVIKAMQKALGERGVSSLAITLGLGVDDRRGMADCAMPHRHRHSDAVAEIGAWLAWLKAEGARQVVLLGHSRGGNQTARFAAEHRDPLVTKVVLMAPSTWSEASERDQYQSRYGKPLAAPLAKAEALVKGGKGADPMTGVDFIYCPGATVTAASFVDYYRPDPRFHTPALLPKIAVPVLVIAAADDQVVKGLPEAVKPLADGKKVSLVTIPQADHFFLDFAAEDAADAVKAFVAN